jgi:poly-gamma-glutamate capsule biosynthesis protein CapA/YwtB (metallophosphatase superfamily)
MNNLAKAKELIQEAKANADFVVVSVQGGAEGADKTQVKNQTEMFYGENRGNMKLFSRTMIDEGADLIIGHGPHVLRGMELYKGKLIAYSLGNFVGDGALSREGILANSIILEVTLNSKGDFIKGKIIPVKINPQGFPFYDNQFSAVKMIQNLVKSDFPESNLLIKDTGELSIKN